MLSSPHDSPFILVLCISRSSRNSDGATLCGAAKQRWGLKMSQFSTNTRHRYIAISQKWLKIDEYIHLSIHVTFTSIVPGAYPNEAKMCQKNVLKWRTFELTGWITGKQLKIDGYMLQGVWQALNPLFIRVTLTAIFSGRTQERPKCALDSIDVAKCLQCLQIGGRQRHTGVTLVR